MSSSASKKPSYSYVCHENCNITFASFVEYEIHHNSNICNPPRHLMCEGCPKSKRIYARITDADMHIQAVHEKGYTASCTMCERQFVTTAALDRHIAIPCTTSTNLASTIGHRCDIGRCKRTFESAFALRAHKLSAKHNHVTPGLKCFGEACKKTFNSPSAMLGHLESGACVCGVDRNSIRRVLMDGDKGGIITDRRAVGNLLQLEETVGIDIGLIERSLPVTPFERSRANSVATNGSTDSLSVSSYQGSRSSNNFDDEIIAVHHEGGVYLQTPIASSAASSGVLVNTIEYGDLRSEDDWSSCGTPSDQRSEASYDHLDVESICEEYPARPMTPSSVCSERSYRSLESAPSSQHGYPSMQSVHSDHEIDSDNESIASDHTEVNFKPFCDLCTEEQRQERGPFPNMKALEQHQRSVFHAPAIYHCPKVSFVNGLKGPGSVDVVLQEEHELESRADKAHGRRSFKTLQGLAAHVESNACKGGKGMFRFALDYLSQQLEGMGLRGKLEYKEIEQ